MISPCFRPLFRFFITLALLAVLAAPTVFSAAPAGAGAEAPLIPLPLDSYADPEDAGLFELLASRVSRDPFNLVATAIFLIAIIHTFMTARIRHLAHEVEHRHRERLGRPAEGYSSASQDGAVDEVSFWGQILHFLGEVEAVFGIWVIALAASITAFKGWDATVFYIGEKVNYTEPIFVVVIMTIAATRPVLRLSEGALKRVAGLGKGSPAAWWLSILILAPIFGSFITEPAAMTIGALLLAKQFYDLKPSPRFCYATLGLLFVNISVGGTFTHFAAPPVLMVAAAWEWGIWHMLTNFGWKAAVGIVASTLLYYAFFRKEFAALRRLERPSREQIPWAEREVPVPAWITVVHLFFLGFTVWQAHHPALFVGGFLFFLAFAQATAHHQNRIDLRAPLLVGFFLAGLVNHGGLQGWWIQPILSRLGEVELMMGATILTAFNDNAAITYLATLVPNFTDELKYAVVAGAVTGGGLTVIANAPNPAGQAILTRYFGDAISPLGLVLGALIPTVIMGSCFMLF